MRKIDPGRNYESTHFWASRGVNSYENFDAVICLGTPYINPSSVLDEAMALFDDPIKRGEWQIWQGESDLLQTIHRIRPIKGGKNIIVMGRTWPRALGKPAFEADQQFKGGKMRDAVNRLKGFVKENGFVTKEIAAVLGVGSKLDEKAMRGVQSYLQTRKVASKNAWELY